ncbi:MAG TPA: FAD-dependent oxidoreductase, partial [Ignavibacteriaceae bacterium]
MKRAVKIIVVGGNAAGPAAAAKAKRFNPNAEVILIEASKFISTGTCEMPYVLSGDIDDYRKIIIFSPSSFQQDKGVKVFVEHFVEEIDTKKKVILVKDLIEDKI